MDADSDSASKRHPDFYKAKMSSSITHHFDPDSSRFQHKTQAMSVDNSDMDESHGKSVPSVFDSEPDQNWCTRIGHKYDCHGGCLPNRRDHRQRNRPFSLGLLLILTCVLLHTLAPCVSAKLELGIHGYPRTKIFPLFSPPLLVHVRGSGESDRPKTKKYCVAVKQAVRSGQCGPLAKTTSTSWSCVWLAFCRRAC
ncbi:hypothetical protein RRG08_019016 [Elysia crispata]|uniref:Uncharacterized protein n=1 Tax=Elysia crispata TaxID=231223 RepID=A0AAE1A5D4_9GAST|nr:hypothetical protein RRG08_019016 [Elysia crispata]